MLKVQTTYYLFLVLIVTKSLAICPIGSYQKPYYPCFPCPDGISTLSTDSTSVSACTICSPGYAGTVINPGTTSASGCSLCPSGSFAADPTGSTNCQLCDNSKYSYPGASSCSSCPLGSMLISSSSGCRPSSFSNVGPVDTSFYLSGSQTEGVSAFNSIRNANGISYFSNLSSFPNEGVLISSGSSISTSLLSTLPSGSSAFTVSSWVNCASSSFSDYNPSGVVVAWGLAGEVSTSANLFAASLAVTSPYMETVVWTTSTIAGSGSPGFADGVGSLAMFITPTGVALDSFGNIYVADWRNNRIRKIEASGVVTTIAGKYLGFVDGTGTNARFYNPTGITVDLVGNVYVSEQIQNSIRKITTSGVVSTLAGGNYGYADGTGSNAKFNSPLGLSVDSSGNIYVADSGNARIRKITSTGLVTTFAGSGIPGLADGEGTNSKFKSPYGVAVDMYGNIYVSDTGNSCIRKITSTGVVTTLLGNGYTRFFSLYAISVDTYGNIFVIDAYSLRKMTSSGVVTTLAGGGVYGFADGAGTNAMFNNPQGVAVDAFGNVCIADSGNNRIRKIPRPFPLPAPLPVCDSTWHHIALTYTGSTLTNKLTSYIDGKSVASIDATFAIITPSSSTYSTLRIGWNGGNIIGRSEDFTGSISDVRIFSRALTQEEMIEISYAGYPLPLTTFLRKLVEFDVFVVFILLPVWCMYYVLVYRTVRKGKTVETTTNVSVVTTEGVENSSPIRQDKVMNEKDSASVPIETFYNTPSEVPTETTTRVI